MYLIVGLGNPGTEYETSRHNAGFRVIDVLAGDLRANYWKSECESLVARVKMSGCLETLGIAGGTSKKTGARKSKESGVASAAVSAAVSAASRTAHTVDDCEIILAKPQTFMNLSGVAVRALCKKYKVDPSHLIVVHDELDIPPATIRVKFGGGHAGHNGLRSIIEKMGTRDWYRVRTGVGRPPGRMDVANFVLASPKGKDEEDFDQSIYKASESVKFLLQNGLEATQQKYN